MEAGPADLVVRAAVAQLASRRRYRPHKLDVHVGMMMTTHSETDSPHVSHGSTSWVRAGPARVKDTGHASAPSGPLTRPRRPFECPLAQRVTASGETPPATTVRRQGDGTSPRRASTTTREGLSPVGVPPRKLRFQQMWLCKVCTQNTMTHGASRRPATTRRARRSTKIEKNKRTPHVKPFAADDGPSPAHPSPHGFQQREDSGTLFLRGVRSLSSLHCSSLSREVTPVE